MRLRYEAGVGCFCSLEVDLGAVVQVNPATLFLPVGVRYPVPIRGSVGLPRLSKLLYPFPLLRRPSERDTHERRQNSSGLVYVRVKRTGTGIDERVTAIQRDPC